MRRVLSLVSSLLACSQPASTTPAATPAVPAVTAAPTPTPPAAEPPPFARDDKVAVRLALKQAGLDLDDHDCLAWPASFPRVVAVGQFAHDRGCELAGIFVDRRFITSDGEVAALATRDFMNTRLAAKEALARAWIDEVVHAFGGEFVTEPGAAFSLPDAPTFAPVFARLNKIGGVVVEGWISEPPGMQDESVFHLVTHRFAPDGKLETESKLRHAVDGPRLRGAEQPKAAPSYAVDMAKFYLTCKRDRDCTLVRPAPCGPCGCTNTPLAARDLAAFQTASAAITCPPPVPLTGGAGCGGCPGYHASCDKGTCVAANR